MVSTDGRTDGRTDGQTDGRTDRRTDTEGYNIIPRHTLVAGYKVAGYKKSIPMRIQNLVKFYKVVFKILSGNEMMTDGRNDGWNNGMTDNPNLI